MLGLDIGELGLILRGTAVNVLPVPAVAFEPAPPCPFASRDSNSPGRLVESLAVIIRFRFNASVVADMRCRMALCHCSSSVCVDAYTKYVRPLCEHCNAMQCGFWSE